MKRREKKHQNNYINTTPDPMFKTFKEMQVVLQQRLPPSARMQDIKHVILDADDTIWDIEPWGLASFSSPIGQTDGDVLEVVLDTDTLVDLPDFWGDIRPRGVATLDPTLRDTLQKLKEKGVPVSIASNNTKRSIMAYLDAFGLTEEFADVEATLGSSKGAMVEMIARRQKVDTENILFVNDSYHNAWDVSTKTKATALVKGFNIASIEDILEFIK